MMSSEKPIPETTDLTQAYWDAAQNETLCLQRCQGCRHWIHFPERACPKCHSQQLGYEQVSGLGFIESFSVVHKSFVAGYDQDTPYVLAWIELDEQSGLRVFSNVLESNTEKLAIGQRVELCFETREGFGKIPQFCIAEQQQ